jgi:hypothetical protein
MITHGTPAAADAGPNLLKISESALASLIRTGRHVEAIHQRHSRRWRRIEQALNVIARIKTLVLTAQQNARG